jgi:hypothetical protein
MFLGIRFEKMYYFVNLLLQLNIYVISSRFKEFRYSKNDISSFFFLKIKIEIFCLLVFGCIVVKMVNFHLFEKVLKFLFHAMEAMGNEIFKNMVFFLTCTCVLMSLCILQWVWYQ